ncbi:MAG: TonB-dependent receptor [Flavobacteriaceae bacterium]|nr:TonB-dependent receptor [Flavobacteriaceae bacterium]
MKIIYNKRRNNLSSFKWNSKMKLMLLILLTVQFGLHANDIYSQKTKINLDVENLTVREVIDIIESNTNFKFIYKIKNVDLDRKVTLHIKEKKIKLVLDNLFNNTNTGYKIRGTQLILIAKKRKLSPPKEVVTDDLQNTVEITGIILDEGGQPLPGANIIEKGTTNGTESDFDGNFTLTVAHKDAVLVISYIGFVTKEFELNGQTTVNITLEESKSSLDEIVITGYGSQAKRELTGSIVTIDSKSITERSTINVASSLQGAVSGVLITRNSSEPGAENTIRIRGNTTLQGSNNPLVLIDDVVGSIEDVTPDQIESISVLKDGAAAAIYGSRAAAGVIIITTKRAKTGVISVTYKYDYFINSPTKIREYVGALDYLNMDNERAWNDNGNDANLYPTWSEDRVNQYITGEAASDRNEYPDTDWANLILDDTSPGYRHDVNISGGSEKIKTNLFLGYESQDALYDHRDWRRLSARVNNDIKISDKFGVIADINFQLNEINRPTVNPTAKALQAPAIYAAVWEDGRYAEGKGGDNIYLQYNEGGFRNSNRYLFTGKLGAFFKPIEGMKISLNIIPMITFNDSKNFRKEVRFWAADDPGQLEEGTLINGQTSNRLIERRSKSTVLTSQALVSYNKSFDKHSFDVLLGFEDRSERNETLGVRGNNFVSPDFPYLNQAPTAEVFNQDPEDGVPNSGTAINELAYTSYFARANYSFNEKYFLSATIRRDGSSRFGNDYRWGNFPSFSAAWVISNENFMSSIKGISFLKLKGSYGTLGNDRLGNYLSLTQLQVNNALIVNGSNVEELRALSQRFLTTPNIQWETTASTNLGFELGLFDHRFSLDFEYFNKETTDMLLQLSVPDLVGFEDPTVNVGDMTTKGWDLTVSWNDRIGEDFSYGISFNMSDAQSIIGNVDGKRLFSDDGTRLSEEGSEFQEFFGYQSDGLFQTQDEVDNSPVTSAAVRPGDVKYKDISGPDGIPDGIINSLDRTLLGGSLPRYYYGSNINMAYKNFDFGMTLQGVANQQFYLSPTFIRPFREQWLAPSQEYANNYWSVNNSAQANQSAKYPRLSETALGNNYTFSDFWLVDGSYLRIKNLYLGYTLPDSITKNAGISRIRFSITGNDLFTFDNLPDGVDPEQALGTGYYLTRTIIFGVKINF